MEEELIRRENMLAKKAREKGVYLFKSRDEIIEVNMVLYSLREDGVIEAYGRNYAPDTRYLVLDANEEGPFSYALVKVVENSMFQVNDEGDLVQGRYYSWKSPSICGLEGIVMFLSIDQIEDILNNHGPWNEKPKYYGLVYSTVKEGLQEIYLQLNILNDYAKKTGIKYEEIFGIVNVPDDASEDSWDVNFYDTIAKNLKGFDKVNLIDVVCHAREHLMLDWDGEPGYLFVEKHVLSEWKEMNKLVNYEWCRKPVKVQKMTPGCLFDEDDSPF